MKEKIDYWHLKEKELTNFNNLMKEEAWNVLVTNPWDVQFKRIDWQDKIEVHIRGCYVTTITTQQYEDLQKYIY